MKKAVVLIIINIMLMISKYVISGAYYDYSLQEKELIKVQSQLLDDNKRAIADLENNRSANYLFSQREKLGLQELTPNNTIILHSQTRDN